MGAITETITASILVSALWAGTIHAESADDYWPAWRGPRACGVAPTGQPPLTWSETQNVKWKVPVPGEGTSSPVVWADKIFFLTAVKTDRLGTPTPTSDANTPVPFHGGRAPKNVYKFDVVCMDRATGRILWQKTAREEVPHEGTHPNHGFASYSPVTDGTHVWASFGSRGVHCYDLNGEHKWSRNLGKMATKMAFGEASSPALAGDALIVVMDHEGESFLHALDKTTGQILWKQPRDEVTSWATPATADVNGTIQVIVSATKLIRAYDARTGEVIWQCSGQTQNVIPTPVAGFGMVFCTSGFRSSALQAIQLGRTGDLSGTDAIRWQVNKGTPYVPSPILYEDKLYVCSVNKAVISCYDAATGKAHFTGQPLNEVGEIYASPVGAAGRVYFVGRDGTTQVIRNAERFEILATNKLDDKIDASPAIVADCIYLKGKQHLYCISATP
ncbi:MAG: PQQ-like beta-propeller repeat protein [Sedimentisphaerales bacterium]|nr:PQQ-like beta-propeller repeat protein [Sedimentisphaerales bacterium]